MVTLIHIIKFWFFCYQINAVLRLEYATQLLPTFLSWFIGQVDTSCRKSVCRFEVTNFIENCVVYDGHRPEYDFVQSDDIEHVWYFKPILEHICFHFSRASVRVCCVWNDFRVWLCVILSHLLYDAQLSLFNYLQTRQMCGD